MGSMIAQKKRLLMMGKLLPPSGYRWIEYARSAGVSNTYFELPIGFDKTDEVRLEAALNNTGNDKFLISPKTWNNNNNRFAMAGGTNNKFGIGFGSVNTGNSLFNVTKDTDFHIFSYKDYVFSLDNEAYTIYAGNITFLEETTNVRLFFGYNTSTSGKIKYYIHKKSGGTVYDIRPIQNISTGEVEMYDTVSKTIMTRVGTFTAPQ